MKSLTTLIKLHKRKLDELRRQMAQIEKQKDDLKLASKKLYEELERELNLAKLQAAMAGFFGGFSKRIAKRQEEIAAEIRKLDMIIQALSEKIAAEFGELKKFEIALENRKKAERAEQNRKDTIALDEIAGQQHRRRKEEA